MPGNFAMRSAQFATGVAIICARTGDGRYVGLAPTRFNSVSLDPPLVLVEPLATLGKPACLRGARAVLRQRALRGPERNSRGASRGRIRIACAALAFRMGWANAPLIDGCVRHGSSAATTRGIAPAITVIFIGEVDDLRAQNGRGLVFHHGQFGSGGADAGSLRARCGLSRMYAFGFFAWKISTSCEIPGQDGRPRTACRRPS